MTFKHNILTTKRGVHIICLEISTKELRKSYNYLIVYSIKSLDDVDTNVEYILLKITLHSILKKNISGVPKKIRCCYNLKN